MKEHNKNARYVDISIMLWFYALDSFVQAGKKNCTKIEIYNKLLPSGGVSVGSSLGLSVLSKG